MQERAASLESAVIAERAVPDESAENSERQIQWQVYIRWNNGNRESVITLNPEQLAGWERHHVLAALPLPHASWHAGRSRRH
jgi:hypothetical protein